MRLHFELSLNCRDDAGAVKCSLAASFLEDFTSSMSNYAGWPNSLSAVSAICKVGFFGNEMASLLRHWSTEGIKVKSWAEGAQRALAFTPSSASVERVFSVFKNSFLHLQMYSLRDYVTLSVMLQYNNRKPSV